MPASTPAAQPLLLDTDIGTDIDDAYALIFAAMSPEFDLRAVTVVNNDVVLRAKIARRLLDLLGRAEVPVGLGSALSLTPGERRGWGGHEGRGLSLSDDAAGGHVPELAQNSPMDAARRIAECAETAHAEGKPLLVCPIGAMTNVALALRCYPDSARKIGRIVAMAADFAGFGADNARTEHNIACDPVAADIVLRSGLPITLVSLNVTNRVPMTLQDVEAIEAIGGPLADALAGMHRVWFEFIKREHSPMHDGLALASVVDSEVVTFTEASATVQPHGERTGWMTYAEPESGVPAIQIASDVDAARFHTLFQGRVQQGVRQAATS